MTTTIPRPALLTAVLDGARSGRPVILTGPPGAGKTTLLLEAGRALEREGRLAVYLDLMGAASSPEGLVAAALGALPAQAFGRHLARATEIRRLAGTGRNGAEAVRALLELLSSLETAAGRHVVLLLDEVTEIRSLAYFKGLRDVAQPFGEALRARREGTLLATSFPTLARRLWPRFDAVGVGPFVLEEVGPAARAAGLKDEDAAALLRASFGWGRHLRVLWERRLRGGEVVSAWAEEMGPGGRLEVACRHTYETLLLRSRGYGMSKAVLAAVALEEGLTLSHFVKRLGRTPGAVRDYLQWLVDVDALRVERKRYFYVDGLVRLWVRLHGRGVPPSEAEMLLAAREAAEAGAGGGEGSPPRTAPAPRVDSLMEID